jgi:hypothetical protein
VIPVSCGGRMFHCVPWQVWRRPASSATSSFMGDEVEMKVYGDGLIAHMIQTGSDFAAEHPDT